MFIIDKYTAPTARSLVWECRKGPVDYPFQAEMWAEQLLKKTPGRTYIWYANRVYAVWSRTNEGEICCVAQSQAWAGRLKLPFLHEDRNELVVSSTKDRSLVPEQDLATWAKQQLASPTVATAVALNTDEIISIWDWSPAGAVSLL